MLSRPAFAWLFALLAVAVLLPHLEPSMHAEHAAGTPSLADVREQLRGEWLREYTDGGNKVRRVMTLEASGAFREDVRIESEKSAVQEIHNEGWWLYDGTNLKRKYTLVNGEPPSRLNLPFATLQVVFDGRNAFTGVDHLRKVQVRYRRIGPAD